GGAPGGIALDDEDLGQGRVTLLTISELSRKRSGVERPFAPCEFLRFARRLAHACGIEALERNLLCLDRMFFEVLSQLLVHQGLDESLQFTVAEFRLGLPLELWLLHFDADHRSQPFADILALEHLALLL